MPGGLDRVVIDVRPSDGITGCATRMTGLAGAAMDGEWDFHRALMIWRYNSGQSRAEGGDVLHAVDVFIQTCLL